MEKLCVDSERASSILDTPEHRNLAREILRKSIVLLKNEDNLLPLKKDIKSMVIIGPTAASSRESTFFSPEELQL